MSSSTLPEKFSAIRRELNQELIERDTANDLVVRMLLGRVHGVFLGSWGVGKSMLIRRMLERIDGVQLFETLLTRNSPAEQVVGPISLKALEHDDFRRVTTGKLPEANVAFLDEIFKSNATVLNNLLSIMNERKFHNNGHATDLPDFWTVYGASNELPVEQREELGAFYDRLAVRMVIEPVRNPHGVQSVLRGQIQRDQGKMIADALTQVSFEEVQTAQNEVRAIDVTDATLEAITAIYNDARNENLGTSIRRIGEGVKLMQAGAWMQGNTATSAEDTQVLEHVLWDDPEDREKASEIVLKRAGGIARKVHDLRNAFEEQRPVLDEVISSIESEDPTAQNEAIFSKAAGLSRELKVIHSRIAKAREEGNSPQLQKVADEVEEARKRVTNLLMGDDDD